MAVLGALFGGTYLAMPSGQKKENGPPINASSQDEEKFIR
jgi:F-type H+-transporting ATPase subunit k